MDGRGRYSLLILVAVFLTYFIENFLRSAPSALSPILIEELGLTYGAAGILISSCLFLYAFMQLPSGILSDALGPRRTIVGFTAFTILGALLFFLARRFELLIVAQILIGFGSSVYLINAVQVISKWFPADKRASAIGILTSASNIGSSAAYLGFPVAMTFLGGWRPLYLFCIVVMVASFVVNLVVIRNSPGARDSTVNGDAGTVWRMVRTTLGNRAVHRLLLGYIFISVNWAFLNWLPQFLTDAKGLSYMDAGFVTSVGSIVGIPDTVVIGLISDRLRNRRLPLIVFAFATTVLLAAFVMQPVGTPTMVSVALMSAYRFTISLWVLFLSMVPETLPSETVGIGLGLLNGSGTLIVVGVTSIYGVLVDITGNYVASNALILASNVLMILTYIFLIRESYGKEVETVALVRED